MSAPAASLAPPPRLLHRPVSPAQRAAARRNGARSCGPRTAAGKVRSSRNAPCGAHTLVCGAKVHLFTAEEPQALHDQVRHFVESMRPRDPVSLALVRRLAFLDFQRRRVWDLDSELWARELDDPLALIPKSATLSLFVCRYFRLCFRVLARLDDLEKRAAGRDAPNEKSGKQTQELIENKEAAPSDLEPAQPSPPAGSEILPVPWRRYGEKAGL